MFQTEALNSVAFSWMEGLKFTQSLQKVLLQERRRLQDAGEGRKQDAEASPAGCR